MDSNVAATQAASAPALSFRGDTADVGFPWAGAALLVLLAVIAIAVRWRATRRAGGEMPKWLALWLKVSPAEGMRGAAATLQASMRLDGQTQLHTVRWAGRELLIATSHNASPVLIDSRTVADVEEPS